MNINDEDLRKRIRFHTSWSKFLIDLFKIANDFNINKEYIISFINSLYFIKQNLNNYYKVFYFYNNKSFNENLQNVIDNTYNDFLIDNNILLISNNIFSLSDYTNSIIFSLLFDIIIYDCKIIAKIGYGNKPGNLNEICKKYEVSLLTFSSYINNYININHLLDDYIEIL